MMTEIDIKIEAQLKNIPLDESSPWDHSEYHINHLVKEASEKGKLLEAIEAFGFHRSKGEPVAEATWSEIKDCLL